MDFSTEEEKEKSCGRQKNMKEKPKQNTEKLLSLLVVNCERSNDSVNNVKHWLRGVRRQKRRYTCQTCRVLPNQSVLFCSVREELGGSGGGDCCCCCEAQQTREDHFSLCSLQTVPPFSSSLSLFSCFKILSLLSLSLPNEPMKQ